MKRIFLTLCLLTAVLGFSACEIDEKDNLYDTLVGRTWVGDLGFYQDGIYPLDSYVYFSPDGFGEDQLRYADTGKPLTPALRIQWEANNRGVIYINYGTVDAPRELRDVYIEHGRLIGELYIGGIYYKRVTLFMQ